MAIISEYPLHNTGLEIQTAIDDALDKFPALINLKANTADVLTKTNTNAYTPTSDYHPATKLYVDTVRPTVTIGQTITGAEGTSALVTNRGTERDAILDFTIPKGDTGAAAGFATPTASTTTLPAGESANVTVTASGAATSKKFDFNFEIPQGAQGIQGYYINSVSKTSGTGAEGTTDTYSMYLNNPERTVVGTFNVYNGADADPNTLTIGSVVRGDEASATITGQAPNQILNLVLPKGDTGERGLQGIQGEQGYYVNKIQRTSGDGTSGSTDTYTMYLNNEDETVLGTFTVYNGIDGTGAGTVRSVGLTATDSSLTISGTPITSTGNISIGHTNQIASQGIQAFYPISIDENGHITSYGDSIDMTTKEDKSNKVTTISSASTNTQYPSALAVYSLYNSLNQNKENISNKVTSISSSSTNTQYPSALAVYNLFNSILNGDEVDY